MKLTEALRAADRIGSCTACEVKELACSPGVKASYIWRSNTISMMSDPLPRQIDLDAAGLPGGGPVPWALPIRGIFMGWGRSITFRRCIG